MNRIVVVAGMMLALYGCKKDRDEPVVVPPIDPPVVRPPPPPEAGTLLRSGCAEDPKNIGIEWRVYADGEGGEYKDPDRKSYKCGYEDPVLSVEVGEAGDAFDPTVISVSALQYGEPTDLSVEWDWERTESTLGKVTRTDEGLEIRSFQGVTGVGEVVVNGEAYQYSLREEPICEHTRKDDVFAYYDCVGNRVSGAAREFIYYGEEDTRMVTVSVLWLHYDSRSTEGQPGRVSLGRTLGGDLYAAPVHQSRGDMIKRKIEQMNEKFALSNIYIELELVGAYTINWTATGGGRIIQGWMEDGIFPWADIANQEGYSREGTCGVAYASTRFGRGSNPRTFQNKCGNETWLHELGHNVGMAHGPTNSGYPARGYMFPDFGHGTMEYCNRSFASIMSYGYGVKKFTNSSQLCLDQNAQPSRVNETDLAGSKTESDEAYHMNRIRYDLSLITERDGEFSDPQEMGLLQYRVEAEEEQGELIVD